MKLSGDSTLNPRASGIASGGGGHGGGSVAAARGPGDQPSTQTLSRVVLMGKNAATKELEVLNIDPETGGLKMGGSVTASPQHCRWS